jgi:dTDP-4-dehydrorhamnose reductase
LVVKILIIGAGGKLGKFLMSEWAGRDEVQGLTRAQVDLRNPEELARELATREFDVVVNCAAVASPDLCQDDPDTAWAVNAVAPRVLARACRERKARVVHFSTDYVLDGAEEGLKDEDAPTFANGEYGRSKRAGEEAVLEEAGQSLVCRVSWVFGTETAGFCEDIVARARRGEHLEAIADKWSMPTYARDIGAWVQALIPRQDLAGVFHLTHTGEPESWWSYGSKVLEEAHALGLLEKRAKILPTKMEDLKIFRAPRPVYTAMRPRRLQEEAGIEVRDWITAARERLALMAAERECH